MNNFDKTSILIVGGGPSGSSAALHALKYNQDCILIDKNEFPRKKLCGGLITEEAVKELLNMDIPLGEIFHKPKHIRFFNKEKLILEFENSNDIYIVDRYEFDYYLLKNYLDRGGKFISKEKLIRIDAENKIAYFDSNRQIKYEYLIAADGANSIIRKKINLKEIPLALCLECFRDNKENKYDGLNVFFGLVYPGFGWSFEGRERTGTGVGTFCNSFAQIKRSFETACRINNPNHVTSDDIKGAFVPYGGCAEILASDNIILTGDSGGFADPILGEGIKYALLTGRYAVEAICSGNYITTYSNLTKDIRRHIKAGVKLQRIFFNKSINKLALYLFEKHKGMATRLTKEIVLEGNVKYYEIFKSIL